MGALKIDCYCNERQMAGIIKSITSHLYNSDGIDVPDYDDVIGDIRVCVSFDAYMDTINVEESEIFDKDWDLLYEDTAVLTSRLKPVLAEYNRNSKEACEQARNIYDDRYTCA
jgi:hypothetical protein